VTDSLTERHLVQHLITDTTITYASFGQAPAVRRARLFSGTAGTRVCVVTETGADTGTSITNAAELVLDAVRDHPALGKGRYVVVEHYDTTSRGGESFDLISRTVAQSEPVWEPLTRAALDRDWPGLADQL
jgi:hypothetical protein